MAELQEAHLRAVPFENLSIHARQPIVLDERQLFAKVVEHRRGGFCYELNGLFAHLLQEIGFRVTLIAAEVGKPDGTFGPAFDHLALAVELDDVFLVDVGFGDSFRRPLRLHDRGPQVQGLTAYRIHQEGEYYKLQQQNQHVPNAPGEIVYRFRRQAHKLAEFNDMCVYHQTSPESHFSQKRVCSRATADGRLTLRDRRLIVTRGRCGKKRRSTRKKPLPRPC
ncbi:arylamine N-acetyltransferase family protein [Hymenobacter volaticus]|uniref:Arylamine N-acetyltransferase n=1 Tax=Hymenobacter volaticus TaxID=2932254 RepID=A0ABY4GEW2_9BACT|nr:arylamine N-acetyltransferase [Hymenobacter volaticus]UOQ69356.1 arylamine N-acetyltransferase [Hymenobacter volaticus]